MLHRQASLLAEGLQIERRVHTLVAQLNSIGRRHQEIVNLLSRFTAHPAEKDASSTPLSAHLKEVHQALPSAAEVHGLIDELVAEAAKLDQVRSDCAKF